MIYISCIRQDTCPGVGFILIAQERATGQSVNVEVCSRGGYIETGGQGLPGIAVDYIGDDKTLFRRALDGDGIRTGEIYKSRDFDREFKILRGGATEQPGSYTIRSQVAAIASSNTAWSG